MDRRFLEKKSAIYKEIATKMNIIEPIIHHNKQNFWARFVHIMHNISRQIRQFFDVNDNIFGNQLEMVTIQ